MFNHIHGPDLMFAVSPPLGLGLSAAMLSRIWGTPYVFHVADLQPDAAVDLKMIRSKSVIKALYAIERIAYRNATLVSTLNEAMRSRIAAKNIDASKVILSPDWAEEALFQIPITGGGDHFRERNGLDGQFLVVHAGNMGVKQGLSVVVEAAELCRDRHDLTFLLVGHGAVRPQLQELAHKHQLKNLRFMNILPAVEFRELMAASDVCLITQQASVADIVFPSKVMSLMAAGRATVASLSEGSEVARVLREPDAGLIVEPGDPKALLDAILLLLADPARRRAMGVRARAYARDRWSSETMLYSMERRLTHLNGNDSGRGVVANRTGDSVSPK